MIGVGTPDAGDDAVGLLAVRSVRSELEAIPGIEVLEVASAQRVLDLLGGAEGVILVDAVRTPDGSRPPGTIVRLEADPSGLPAEIGASLSSHGLGLAEVLGLAATLGSAPRVVVLGVEVAETRGGASVSARVGGSVHELGARVLAEARALSSV